MKNFVGGKQFLVGHSGNSISIIVYEWPQLDVDVHALTVFFYILFTNNAQYVLLLFSLVSFFGKS